MALVFDAILPKLLALSAAPALSGEILALRAISNGALAGKELPKRLKLLDWGVNETVSKGPVKVGPNTVAALAANQAALGFDEVVLDYNHNSLPGHPNFQPDPRKVAAYGKIEVIEGDGLYLTALSYTPSGEENAREYRDLSPSPLLDDDGQVVFVHSVALCPQGEVKGLSFFSVDVTEALSASKAAPDPKTKTNQNEMDYKKLLCLILALDPASATDAEIEAAAKKFGEEEKAEPEHKEGKENNKAEEGAENKEIKALSAQVSQLADVVTDLSKIHDSRERDAILSRAISQGKIVPMSARTLPLADFQKIVDELLPNQVPLEQRTPENLKALAAGTALPNTQESEIERNLGITKEMKDKVATA